MGLVSAINNSEKILCLLYQTREIQILPLSRISFYFCDLGEIKKLLPSTSNFLISFQFYLLYLFSEWLLNSSFSLTPQDPPNIPQCLAHNELV